MKKTNAIIFFTLVAGMICCLSSNVIQAEDTGVDGSVGIGVNYASSQDSLDRAGEYEAVDDEARPDISIDLFANSDGGYGKVEGEFQDEETFNLHGMFKLGKYIKNVFSYDSFYHRDGADMLENLSVRELVDPSTNKPGGKMLTHDLVDLHEELGVTVTELRNVLELAMPFAPNMKVSLGYRNLAREGYRQANSINHCMNCHVVGRRIPVDETTEETTVTVSGAFSWVRAAYEFMMSDYESDAAPPTNYWDDGLHPVNGDKGDEFGSRLIYDDYEGEYATIPATSSTSHKVKVDADLGSIQRVVASLSQVTTENEDTDIEVESRYGALRWSLTPSKRAYFTALFSRQMIESDDYFIDLPSWRDGQPGGGQDFDYDRESVADREETLGRLSALYRLTDVHRVTIDYRFRQVDRDYWELGYDDSTTETEQHRIRAAWDMRLPSRLKTRLVAEYETTDHPFLHPNGINELSAHEGQSLPDNSFYYYFQRQRIGEVTNQPTATQRISFNVTYPVNPKVGLNFQTRLTDENNDELNTYEWEQRTFLANANINLIPSDGTILTLGYNHMTITSNAMMSAPVMDG